VDQTVDLVVRLACVGVARANGGNTAPTPDSTNDWQTAPTTGNSSNDWKQLQRLETAPTKLDLTKGCREGDHNLARGRRLCTPGCFLLPVGIGKCILILGDTVRILGFYQPVLGRK
jgi:hypothetical protein